MNAPNGSHKNALITRWKWYGDKCDISASWFRSISSPKWLLIYSITWFTRFRYSSLVVVRCCMFFFCFTSQRYPPFRLITFPILLTYPYFPGTQEKPFDIVTAVKFDCEVHQFRHRQCGTGNIVAAAIDTVGAIEHAVICQHDLQQRNPLSLYHYEGCSY